MTVDPIRDKKIIQTMQTYLKGKSLRDWLLFNVGINTGLRIGDILKLKVSDVKTENMNYREHLTVIEEKTGKTKKLKMNSPLKKYFDEFIKANNLQHDDFFFQSRKGHGHHISKVQAYRVLEEAAKGLGVQNFGTHSMRKTWGYWAYKASKYNIALIMEMFNHSSQSITLRYIGINQEMKDDLYCLVEF
jgi:integrase